uniref:Prepilin-type N-terminal cleavage/methylation domain-containing protein n=1 Tax=Thermodesulfovibrio aggregans TaxID=86166 RepID=A0A7C4AKA2_9BACT
MDRKIAGFSILELLIIIAILSILMYVGYSQYIKYKADRELMRQVNMLADEISWIKSQAVAKEPYGIVINIDSYTIFKDSDGNCNFSTTETIRSQDFISKITATASQTLVFDRKGYPRSTTCALGTSSITLKNINNNQKIIEISKYGRTQIK